MINNQKTKTPMPIQDAKLRIKNFDEVALGYTLEQAQNEALRCLSCKNSPCTSACPVGVNIKDFIAFIKQGDFEKAYHEIAKTNCLPAVCGRVCPQETQCESKCVCGIKGQPVAIGRLERFVADWYAQHEHNLKAPLSTKQKIAVVGSGPSGLACAGDLAKLGYKVTVFEALHTLGGVLVYGIPHFRLPKEIVFKEVENLKKLGVEFCCDVVVGKTLDVDELKNDGFSAIYLATGAGLPKFMNIKGEHLSGVYSANEYLTRINLMKAYQPTSTTPILKGKKVCVVGGGNVAMDAARSALRMGSEVHVVYRRSEKELPARKEEIEHGKEEGLIFDFLTNPIEVLEKDGFVRGLKCVKMQLGAPDQSGRRRPEVIENSQFIIDCDLVIMALGTSPNPLLKTNTPNLETDKWGCIVVDENLQTSIENVYAGGDATTGSATVILAMSQGKKAAKSINEKLSK
ncbi:MAG: NADPH-dependent glutamate synthase [Clostridia bacterium]|nr:NADPH-dependent glutamate synthase [Clostridia bacterium]